ncbi:unnamed protein product [Polarella glacialis]|uniref:Uncharacterized protein n=2 Tax=Polarella glacialis TaxID=89957 RepID=A0A813KFV0_POLGL|nr:unnamed protein product [Polarella glacialis]
MNAFHASSHEEMMVMAYLVGSDFNTPQVEVTVAWHWSEVAIMARTLLTTHGSWQAAVRASSPEGSAEPDGFLDNFDVGSYVVGPQEGKGIESWTKNGDLVIGITCCFPLLEDLDPVLVSCREWIPQEIDMSAQAPLHPDRILRAYALGCLSSHAVRLLRFASASTGVSYADIIPGNPVPDIKRTASLRISQYLRGPEKDSWDAGDDDFGHPDPRFHSITYSQVSATYLGKARLQSAIVELVKLNAEAHKIRYESETRFIAHMERIQNLRDSILADLDPAQLIKEVQLSLDSEDLGWMWDEVKVEVKDEDASTLKSRAACFFFLATGKLLPKLKATDQQVVEDCVAHRGAPVQKSLMYLICLATLGDGIVVPEQMQQLRASLGLSSDHDCELICPSYALRNGPNFDNRRCAGSALLLGQLCSWLESHLQDCFCLCGGEGRVFPEGIPLDGRLIVVMDDGQIHKAKDGYKISISAPKDQVVSVEVLGLLHKSLSSSCQVVQKTDWLKMTGVSAVEAFGYHRRIWICNSVPYTLNVKAFDTSRRY